MQLRWEHAELLRSDDIDVTVSRNITTVTVSGISERSIRDSAPPDLDKSRI